jgi:hypothetical protein
MGHASLVASRRQEVVAEERAQRALDLIAAKVRVIVNKEVGAVEGVSDVLSRLAVLALVAGHEVVDLQLRGVSPFVLTV